MTDILILNDFVSRGKIAGNMLSSVLAYKDFNTYFIPTALISNNFDYGQVAKLDTFTYIKESLDVYKDLGFTFDMVFIGYVEDKKTTELIIDYINNLPYRPEIILDPIMGDNGKLYKGVDEEKIGNYKALLDIADITTPNFTEANFLGLTDYEKLISDDKKYVITSVNDDEKYYILGIDKELTKVDFEKIDVRLAGTGDLFDALFLSNYIETHDFKSSVENAATSIDRIIRKHINERPCDADIYIESYFDLLD